MNFDPIFYHLRLRQEKLNKTDDDYQWVFSDPVVGYLAPVLSYVGKAELISLDETSEKLSNAAYYQNQARWFLWKPVFVRITEIFESKQIEMLPLKAFAYGEQLYPDRGFRKFSDIDILVKPAKFLPAIRTLINQGFELVDENIEVLNSNPQKVSEVSLRSPSGCLVEIHQTILPVKNFFRYEIGVPVDHQEIWEQALNPIENKRNYHLMSLEHTLAHLCLHAATHGLSAQSPFTYLDIDCWLRAASGQIDWEIFLKIVTQWKIKNAAFHAFQLCLCIYKSPIPSATLHQLDPGFWAKWRVSLVYSFEDYINHNIKRKGISNPKLVRLMLHDFFIDIIRILLSGFFPPRNIRQAVYDSSVSFPRHWLMLLRKFRSQTDTGN